MKTHRAMILGVAAGLGLMLGSAASAGQAGAGRKPATVTWTVPCRPSPGLVRNDCPPPRPWCRDVESDRRIGPFCPPSPCGNRKPWPVPGCPDPWRW